MYDEFAMDISYIIFIGLKTNPNSTGRDRSHIGNPFKCRIIIYKLPVCPAGGLDS